MVAKVLPATKVESLKIRHYYRSRDSKQSTKPVFEADELTRRGIDYTGTETVEVQKTRTPRCWKEMTSET